MKHESIARVCHEANRALQIELGDLVSPPWEEVDPETIKSIIEGVKGVLLEGLAPRESHESWCEFKVKHGWVYGPEKDFEKKTHPNLVDYDELPEEQQTKDDLFYQIVWSLEPLLT